MNLSDAFEPHARIEWDFGGGVGSGHVYFKAGLTGADLDVELRAMTADGRDVTGSLEPEVMQRIHERIIALIRSKPA